MPTYAEKHWSDCSKAVAYELNFVQICYNDSAECEDFFASSCPHEKLYDVQIKDFEYNKGDFSKKDYYALNWGGCGVSRKLMEDMLAFGAEPENFRPIYTKNHKTVLGYSLSPIHTLPPIAESNHYIKKCVCEKCGMYRYEYPDEAWCIEAYGRMGYPLYITQEVLDDIQPVNATSEFGEVIISLDMYNYLIEKYPRLECRPVFLGNLSDDAEYIRLREKYSDSLTYAQQRWGNCSEAVAYSLNFEETCFMAEGAVRSDYFASRCRHFPDLSVQSKDFEYPAEEIPETDYYKLDCDYYAVSPRLMNDMIEFGVDKENFRPIYDCENHKDILGYSISPADVLPSIAEVNGWECECDCEKCGIYGYYEYNGLESFDAYEMEGYPVYITQEALDKLRLISSTFEFGAEKVLISLDLYNYLIAKYPRLECRPVFFGDIHDDAEYIRLHK